MAATLKIVLLPDEVRTASEDSKSLGTQHNYDEFVGLLKVSEYQDGSFSAVVEHSPDGVNWETIATLPALSANGIQVVEVTATVFPKVRARLTVAGATLGAKIECSLLHGKKV
jgi:hypothetical protein